MLRQVRPYANCAVRICLFKDASKSRGFSLLEVIIATIIGTIMAGTILTASAYSKRIQIDIRTKMTAMSIMEKEVQDLRVINAESLFPGTTTRTTTAANDGLDGTLTTEIIADAVNVGDKFVRVHFAWEGGNRQEALTSFLFQE